LVIQPFYIKNDFFFNKLINNKELLYNKNIKNSFFYHLLIDKNINFLTNKWVGGNRPGQPSDQTKTFKKFKYPEGI
jgi:hypothetical protein